MSSSSGTDTHVNAIELESALQRLSNDSGCNVWKDIEHSAQEIADSLRLKIGIALDEITSLGQSNLPHTLVSLLRHSQPASSHSPKQSSLPAVYQLLRVSANICVDHDANRAQLLSSGLPDLVLTILKSYISEGSVPISAPISDVSISHLQVIKTALGVLINASYGYQPVRTQLIQSDAPYTVLCLYALLYRPTEWQTVNVPVVESTVEEWQLRQGIGAWAWKFLSELRAHEQELGTPLFNESALPKLVIALEGFIPRSVANTSFPSFDAKLRADLANTDLEALEESVMLIESLCLDLEAARVRLALDDTLKPLVQFIEDGAYPETWLDVPAVERKSREKTFDICKGALINALTTVAGEDRNAEKLWTTAPLTDLSPSPPIPDHWFTHRMLSWIHDHSQILKPSTPQRDDLLICGTLCIGNLARRDLRSIQLTREPTNVVPAVVLLLDKKIDIKVKNGAAGLLKTLSQPPTNRELLGAAGALEALSRSGIWDEINDMAELVQGFAIGAVKHMCHGNASNSVRATTQSDYKSCLEHILSLVKRSDSIAIKSEGTRVLVNVIKSLCSPTAIERTFDATNYHRALEAVTMPDQCLLLAQLLGRSQKYSILLNESIVSMTLVALQAQGATGILNAILSPIWEDSRLTSKVATSSQSSDGSPTGRPQAPIEVLNAVLASAGNKFATELRTNACSLIFAICKGTSQSSAQTSRQRAALKDSVKDTLDAIAAEVDTLSEGERALKQACTRAISAL